MLALLESPKYTSLQINEEWMLAFQLLMSNSMLPILEDTLGSISPDAIDSTLMQFKKEAIPQLERIDFKQHFSLASGYWEKAKTNRRGVGLLFDFYDNFIALPLPFDESLHKEAFYMFVRNIIACWDTAQGQPDKFKRIYDSVHNVSNEHERRKIALVQLSRQVEAIRNLQHLERIRSSAELVGKIVATCIEPMIGHSAEIIAIVIDKTAPSTFGSRVKFMQSHCPTAGIDISFLKLDDLSFVRNAVAHAGLFFDYEDDLISLKNISGSKEEIRKFSLEEIEELALLAIAIINEFGEYLKYVAFRYNSHRDERKRWVKNMIESLQNAKQ